jgi:hypothetical protein
MVCFLHSFFKFFYFSNTSIVYGGGVYDYNSYYTSGGAGVSGSAVDNITGQQESNSPTDANNYDHDNRYGKAKTSIVSSPNYHTYPIT